MLIFALANGVLGQGVFALGLDRYYMWTAIAAALFNVVGNLLLMSVYGVWAAAWMTVATEVVLGMGLSAALFTAWKKMRSAEQAG
jgi:O-antigen/teichoic acid export membrane protein